MSTELVTGETEELENNPSECYFVRRKHSPLPDSSLHQLVEAYTLISIQ
jgi:hypothetical protein